MAGQHGNYVTISPLTAATFAVLGALAGAVFVLAGQDVDGIGAQCAYAPNLHEPIFHLPGDPETDQVYLPAVTEIPRTGGQCQL